MEGCKKFTIISNTVEQIASTSLTEPLESIQGTFLVALFDGQQKVLDRGSVFLQGHDPEADVEANKDQDEDCHANL